MPLKSKARVKPAVTIGLLAALAVASLAAWASVTGAWLGAPPADAMSEAESARLTAAMQGVAVTPTLIDVEAAGRDGQLAVWLDLPEEQQEAVLTAHQRGDLRVGLITLADSLDEDGDVVRITAGGLTRTIVLTHQPTTIAVPFRVGDFLSIEAIADGAGGGVTAAVGRDGAPLALPPLAPGAAVTLPMR